jgi:hypothetical protein
VYSSFFFHDDDGEDGDEENNENSTTPATSTTAGVLTDAITFSLLLSIAITSCASICLCESSSHRTSKEDRS